MSLIQCKKCEKAFDASLTPPGNPLLCTYCGFDNSLPVSAAASAAPPPLPYGYASSEKNTSEKTSSDDRQSCEWERDWRSTPLKAYINTLKALLGEPVQYFKKFKPFEDYTSLVVLVYINSFIVILASMLLQMVVGFLPMMLFPGKNLNAEEFLGGFMAIPIAICMAFVFPFVSLLGLWLLSGLNHFFLVYVGGSQKKFDTTLSVNAMNTQLGILGAVPLVGGLVAMVYNFIVGIGGQAEAHEIPVSKALLAFLIPLLICCCCLFGGVGLGIGIPAMVEGLK